MLGGWRRDDGGGAVCVGCTAWMGCARQGGVRTWCLSLLDGDGGKINYVFFNSFLNSSVPNDEMMIGTIILSSGAHT